MSVKPVFKALSKEQQAVVTTRRVAGERTPEEWLRFLGAVAEFDEQADALRLGGGGFWARRYAKKHDLPNGLRWFAVPLLNILREDHDPATPLELRIDLTGAEQQPKILRVSQPYAKGRYHKVVDTVYADPWLEGHAHFVDGADVEFSVTDHLRASARVKRSASGRLKQRRKEKKKVELAVTLTVPARNYAAAGAAPVARDVRKASVKAKDRHTVVKLSRVVMPPTADAVPGIDLLLELIGAAYERVDPARRKKL